MLFWGGNIIGLWEQCSLHKIPHVVALADDTCSHTMYGERVYGGKENLIKLREWKEIN